MSDSIKVAIKVRPLISREKTDNLPTQWSVQGNTIAAIDAEIRKRGDSRFEFDHIFDTSATNKNVFNTIVQPIVDAAVNGFNATAFAYGQTSSGKTYTMMGTSDELGIIPLAIEHMFDVIADMPEREFLLRVSYLEIYNERVNDLLSKNAMDLKVHEDINGQVFVKCKEEVTNCPENVMSLMHKGNKNRRIGETNMNERSSRSHTIFRITIESREAGADSDRAIQVSQLNLVDLAGSERARQTGATGERFKEGRHINLSLSTLALVIKQLSESQDIQKYINFRDSKLTRLLQTSLGGNAMTVIICAVTPVALDETQCTLSFASRARNIKNKPELNEVMSDGVLLKRYAKQIDVLHAELAKVKQLAGTADFLELETKMQEKDRVNQCLEQRIRLLQTRIVHGDTRNNTQSFKRKAKRRQTWCGTGAYKMNMSVFQPCANLSPIREMSPTKSHNGQPSDIIDTSFQIAYTDFELELIKNEEDSLHDEDTSVNSDEDSFVTHRRQNYMTFAEKLDAAQNSMNNESRNEKTPERINTQTIFTQTVRSPDTPKETLKIKIRDLTKEYSQLQEYTTLEKQLHFEDHDNEFKGKLARLSTLEREIENITSDKEAFEHIASDLRKKLVAAELRHTMAEDRLNEQLEQLQKIPDLERRIAQLSAYEIEARNVSELQKQLSLLTAEKDSYEHVASELRKKFNESEQRNVLLEDKLAAQNEEAPVARTLVELEDRQPEVETQISALISEKDELQCKVIDLQNKLAEADSCSNSMRDQLSEQQSMLQNFESTVDQLRTKLSESEVALDAMRDQMVNQPQQDTHKVDGELEKQMQDAVRERTENEFNEHEIDALKKTDDPKVSSEASSIEQNSKFECVISELREELREIELLNSSIESKKDDQVSEKLLVGQFPKSPKKDSEDHDDEVDHLKNHAADLQQDIVEDVPREDTSLKERVFERSMISDHEYNLSNDDSRMMSSSRISQEEEDSTRLSMDLLLKNQELDEIKQDVQNMKTDMISLQETIYLLTTENSELASKLSSEKEYAEKRAMDFQQTIDELYARSSKLVDEKLNAESNLMMLGEHVETLRSRIPEVNLDEKQIIIKYEEQLSALTARNTELLSNVADRMKELETLKESKSLLYEHDCMYKDRLTNLMEKYDCLTAEYNKLSTELMDKVDENDNLTQERDILRSKLELSLKSNENLANGDAERLKLENTLLKTELVEVRANVKVLTEKNSKISNQLEETIEDLDKMRNINSYSDTTLHLSTLFDNTSIMNDTVTHDISTKDNSAEARVLSLQEQVSQLTHLNRKLSDLKLSACTQCTHLKELNDSRRMLKLEVRSLNRKLENLQREFNSNSARSDMLILKAKEDMNVSLCNSSLNLSFSENMNVSYVEDRLQSLSSELQTLKEEHNKLSDLYKEKCNEIEELQNNTIVDDDPNVSVRRSPNRTLSRLDNVVRVMSELQSEFEIIKENNTSVKTDLTKFTSERDSLLLEINSLTSANEDLSQRLSENEHLRVSALEKSEILETELADLTKKLQELTIKRKEMENAQLLLEIDTESLREDRALKESTISDLRQNLSCLQHELDAMKEQREELDDDNDSLKQEYEKKLQSLKAKHEELSESKAAMEQKLIDCVKEAENKLVELNEKMTKYQSENDYLKQELIKLRDIEDKYEKTRDQHQSRAQRDKTLLDDNKKLKDALNDTSNSIFKEIKALKPKMDIEKLLDNSVDELFRVFLQTILAKEKEIVQTMRERFDKERQRLEDEKRQSVDSEKRTTLWAKELELEIEKLQGDLSARETTVDGLQKEAARVQQLLEESDRDRDALRQKIDLLEVDCGNLQSELKKYSRIDTANEEAVNIAQKRERQAQETIKNKEVEHQLKLKTEKEAYNKRVEDLGHTIDSFKTKNMELASNIEGLEAHEKQLRNIIDLKANELVTSSQIIQKMQAESEQLTEAYNDLAQELEQKKLCVDKLTDHLKIKSDELTELKSNLETALPENHLLKQQVNERKASVEQYKLEIETLKMERTREYDRLKDQLSFEELKSVELSKQIADLSNSNVALTQEINTLRDDHATLERKCASLERRVRNSTSKVQAEEQMEELKDLNRSLRNNLDGASNRITELQTAKTGLMKQLVTLNSQYDTMCQENQELRGTLSYKSRQDNTAASGTYDDNYDVLLQEKNRIALELEATKFHLNQKDREHGGCADKIKDLTEKNTELDHEAEELADVIREHDSENARLQDQLFSCRDEVDELREQIKRTTTSNTRDLNARRTRLAQRTDASSAERAEKPSCHNDDNSDDCRCTILKTKIRELQLEIVSKNGKIATLELQIRSGSYPYQEKCRELQEHLLAHKNKNNELKMEVKRLQTAMLRSCTKECDVCKQRFLNRRNQACQTIPTNVIRFCSTSSGIIEDEVRINKLEKEKTFMKDLCRSRSKTIRENEKRIADLEKLLQPSSS